MNAQTAPFFQKIFAKIKPDCPLPALYILELTSKPENIGGIDMGQIRRGVILLLCLCMTLSLCACGGKQDTVGNTTGGRDTEAATPSKEEPAAPPSDGPIPLSQYIQSSAIQILYQAKNIDKDAKTTVGLIQNNTVIWANPGLTLGELSRMSDEEVVQAVMGMEEPPAACPCLLSLETDSTGNNVKSETLWYYKAKTPYDLRLKDGDTFTELAPVDGVVYDSTYTGYWNADTGSLTFLRGEQLPFVLDEIGAEGVKVDPGKEWERETLLSFARIELADGTRISPLDIPATGNEEINRRCTLNLTGSNQTSLSMDKIQWTDMDGVDISPSVLCDSAVWMPLLGTEYWWSDIGVEYHPNFSDRSGIFLEHTKDGLLICQAGLRNLSGETQHYSKLTLTKIFGYYGQVNGKTGTIETFDDLIREYGTPNRVAIKCRVSTTQVRIRMIYEWTGEGFHILAAPESPTFLYVGHNADVQLYPVNLYGSNSDNSMDDILQEVHAMISDDYVMPSY